MKAKSILIVTAVLVMAVSCGQRSARNTDTAQAGATVMDEAGTVILDEAGATVMDEAGATVLDKAGATIMDEAGATVMDEAGAEAAEMEQKYAPKIKAGTPVEDFTAKTSTGEDFTFSSLKGSYVVLDFWASWCPDCREEIPAVRELVKEFEPKGVKFVSFSVDDSAEAWQDAVAEENMEWLQVSNLVKWKENPVANGFGMSWIPTMFLIDPDGKVVCFALTTASMRAKLQKTLYTP